MLASVFYMSIFKAVLWNALFSVAICLVLLSQNMNGSSVQCHPEVDCVTAGVYSEVQVFVCVLFASIGICTLCKGCLRSQVEAENAEHAVYGLLSVLCDAVFQVDSGGRIEKSTPHLRHLLRAGEDDVLEGTLFGNYFEAESDRLRFARLLHGATGRGALPEALHLDMTTISGEMVPVQLYCAYRSDESGQTGILVGIRQTVNLLNEVEAKVPASTDQDVLTSGLFWETHKKDNKRSRRSHSSSSSSTATQPVMTPLPSLESILVTFDLLNDTFPIKKLALKWHCADIEAPSLMPWVLKPSWNDFELWAQTSLNALSAGHPNPAPGDLGPLVLQSPLGGCAALAAKSFSLGLAEEEEDDEEKEDEEDGCGNASEGLLVTLRLQDCLQYSRHRKRRVRLTSITESHS